MNQSIIPTNKKPVLIPRSNLIAQIKKSFFHFYFNFYLFLSNFFFKFESISNEFFSCKNFEKKLGITAKQQNARRPNRRR